MSSSSAQHATPGRNQEYNSPASGPYPFITNNQISRQVASPQTPPGDLQISPRRSSNVDPRPDVIDLMGEGIKSTHAIDFYRRQGVWPARNTATIDIELQFVICKHIGGKHEHSSLYRTSYPANECRTMRQLVAIATKERRNAYYGAGIVQAPTSEDGCQYSFRLCCAHGHDKGRAIPAATDDSVLRWFEVQVKHGTHTTPRINVYYIHGYA